MSDYTLKNIPEEIYQRVVTSSENAFRSLNQEIIFRLKRSFDAEDARLSAVHARWVAEALEAGPAVPLNMAALDAAINNGKARSQKRKAKAA